MLYIHYTEADNTVRCPSMHFDHGCDTEWMKDEFVKEMVKGVDKSDVIDVDCVRSPVLGTIPLTKLSGGVKALILMYKVPEDMIWATACGDNCAEWIIRISEKQDLHIMLSNIMRFPRDFNAICVDNGRHISTLKEYYDNAYDMLYGEVG